LVWFAANTSQVIQPLDGAPYASLKANLRKARDDAYVSRSLEGRDLTQVIAEVTPHVERASFTPEVVTAGFRDRGVWPFDPDLIIERSKAEFLRNPDAESEVLNEAQEVLNFFIEKEKVKRPAKVETKRVSGIKEKNTLYTPEELIEWDEQKKEEKRKEAEEKEAKKKEKEELKKKKKEQLESEKKEKEERKEAKKKEMEEKKKEMEAKKAAKAKEKESKKAAKSDRSIQRSDSFVVDDEYDEEFEEENDENDYPVNQQSNVVTSKRKRSEVCYSSLASHGNKTKKS